MGSLEAAPSSLAFRPYHRYQPSLRRIRLSFSFRDRYIHCTLSFACQHDRTPYYSLHSCQVIQYLVARVLESNTQLPCPLVSVERYYKYTKMCFSIDIEHTAITPKCKERVSRTSGNISKPSNIGFRDVTQKSSYPMDDTVISLLANPPKGQESSCKYLCQRKQ